MASLAAIVKELWALFVDDGSLALGLIAWVAISGLALPRLPISALWEGPVLFGGCLVILVVNVVRSAHRSSGGKGK